MRPADRAWLVLAGGVAAWDLTCGPGETLSEACTRHRLAHPLLTYGVVGYVALHLVDLLPERWDVLHRVTRLRWRQTANAVSNTTSSGGSCCSIRATYSRPSAV